MPPTATHKPSRLVPIRDAATGLLRYRYIARLPSSVSMTWASCLKLHQRNQVTPPVFTGYLNTLSTFNIDFTDYGGGRKSPPQQEPSPVHSGRYAEFPVPCSEVPFKHAYQVNRRKTGSQH